jgi:hypothetical protein
MDPRCKLIVKELHSSDIAVLVVETCEIGIRPVYSLPRKGHEQPGQESREPHTLKMFALEPITKPTWSKPITQADALEATPSTRCVPE